MSAALFVIAKLESARTAFSQWTDRHLLYTPAREGYSGKEDQATDTGNDGAESPGNWA